MSVISDRDFSSFCIKLFKSPLPLVDEFFLPVNERDISTLSLEDFCFFANSTRHASLFMNASTVNLPDFYPSSIFSDNDLATYLDSKSLNIETSKIITALKFIYNFKKDMYNLIDYINSHKALNLSDIPSDLYDDIPFDTIPVDFNESFSIGSAYCLPNNINFISLFGWLSSNSYDAEQWSAEIIKKYHKLNEIIDNINSQTEINLYDF